MNDTLLDGLTAWLDDPQYDTGVSLYKQLAGPGFMLKLFQAGPDDYNRAKLRTLLTEAHGKLQAEADELTKAMPDSLKNELAGAGLLMDERTVLKEKMRSRYNLGDSGSEELRAMAYRILDIRDQLDGIFSRRTFFAEHGFLPGDEARPTDPDTPTDLLKRRNTLRTYVTRYRKEFNAAPGDEARKRVAVKLRQYQTELTQVDQLLADALPD